MKRRKRRSGAAFSERALADIRRLHRNHLREISAILSNTLGFPVRVSLVKAPIVDEKPRKRLSRVSRQTGEIAGYGESPLPAVADDDPFPDDEGPWGSRH